MPGIILPTNLIGNTDLLHVSKIADILFFALPHQHLSTVLSNMQQHVKPNAKAVSLMKVLFDNIFKCF